jgi:DNA-binding response OmpR family regulator
MNAADRDSTHAALAALRTENDELRAQIKVLTDFMDMGVERLRGRFNLTRTEGSVLAYLSDGLVKDRPRIVQNCCGETADDKMVDVYICKLRRKIAPHTIATIWGTGYRIEGESLAYIVDVIAGREVTP